ncbi:MAG: hypothetical protein ACOX47_05030 [Bacillota bacterium]
MGKKSWNGKLWGMVETGEKILVRIVIFGLVALVGVQAMLTSDSMRFYLSFAERLEGQPFQEWSNPTARVLDTESSIFAHLTVELKDFSSLSKAKLLVNGEEIADFRNKKITVKVYPDDIISIDGTFYNRPLAFEISEISPNISWPVLHQIIETKSTVEHLGQVKFK